MMKIANAIQIKKFVLNAIKDINSTVQAFASLNLLLEIVKLKFQEFV